METFTDGCEVWWRRNNEQKWTKDTVAKVYKTGRFILASDASKSQWSKQTRTTSVPELRAYRSGSYHSSECLMLADEIGNKKAEADNGALTRSRRLLDVERKLEGFLRYHRAIGYGTSTTVGRIVTDEMLDALEAALALLPPIPK